MAAVCQCLSHPGRPTYDPVLLFYLFIYLIYLFTFSKCEMGQREVWCCRAEHWGATHGFQGSALRPDRSPARQTEGHGEGRHSEGKQVHVNKSLYTWVLFYWRVRLKIVPFLHGIGNKSNEKTKISNELLYCATVQKWLKTFQWATLFHRVTFSLTMYVGIVYCFD